MLTYGPGERLVSSYGPYPGLVRRVHDGDTISIDLDLGFGVTIQSMSWELKPWLSCRVQMVKPDGTVTGINAPELSTPAGKVAWAYAQSLLPIAARVTVASIAWDKYGGRYDGTITLPDGRDFGSLMVAAGQAVEKDYG